MGCCCDKDEIVYDADQDDEGTRLINSRIINVQPPSSTLAVLQDDVLHTPVSDRSDEHTAWNSILHSTNGDMIRDVEREAVEYQEQKARSALYRERLISCSVMPPSNPHALPAGVTSPNEVLFAQTVSQENLEQISELAHNMSQAVHSVKAVSGHEPLVVTLATFL